MMTGSMLGCPLAGPGSVFRWGAFSVPLGSLSCPHLILNWGQTGSGC